MDRNPLNSSDVDGNTIAWMAEMDRTRADDGDEPICPQCGKPFVECECDI